MKTVTKFITETLDGSIYETTKTTERFKIDGVLHTTHTTSKTKIAPSQDDAVGLINNNTKNIIDSIKKKGTSNE